MPRTRSGAALERDRISSEGLGRRPGGSRPRLAASSRILRAVFVRVRHHRRRIGGMIGSASSASIVTAGIAPVGRTDRSRPRSSSASRRLVGGARPPWRKIAESILSRTVPSSRPQTRRFHRRHICAVHRDRIAVDRRRNRKPRIRSSALSSVGPGISRVIESRRR